MSHSNLQQTVSVVIATDDDLSEAFYIGDADGGSIEIPSTFDGSTLNFQVCLQDNKDTGTFAQLQQETSTGFAAADFANITAVATGDVLPLPTELFGHGYKFCKIVTPTQSTTNTDFIVSLWQSGQG